MCRFLAYWGHKPQQLDYFFLDAPNSLTRQSQNDSSGRPNPDGWGIAYYRDDQVEVVKMSNPAFQDPQFRFLPRRIQSHIIFGHVRRKSYGEVCYENTHPFVRDGWIFMHNGNIPDLPRIRQMLEWEHPLSRDYQPRGETDSEFMFHYVLQLFRQHRACDFNAQFTIIRQIIQQIEKATLPEDYPELALNFVMANHRFLFAYRRHRTLVYRKLDGGVLIASETMDHHPDWKEVPEGYFLVGSQPGTIHLKPLEWRTRKEKTSLHRNR